MKAIKLAWLELRRLRSRRLVLAALVLGPLLYGGVLLWSTWDTYDRLGEVPVAVVNSDRPVDAAGMRIDAGREFVEQLKASDVFDWRFVDAAEARRGLRHGDYYFTVRVPRDFSATLATAATPDPRRAALEITKNDANGYLAGIMADTAEDELHDQINAAAHGAYARMAFGELADVRAKLEQAAEGSNQLVRATDFGKQGVAALSDGLDGIRDSAGEVADGARRVSEATARLDQEVADTARFTTQELPEAASGLARTSDTAVNSLSAIKTATGFLVDRAEDSRAMLESLGQRHPSITDDPVYQHALGNARQLAAAAANADGEAQRALDTAHEANSQAWSLRNNIGSLGERIQAIQAPTDSLRSGTAQLAGGSSGVSTGLRTLAAGNGVLRSGTDQLSEGAKRLHGTVVDTLHRIPPTNPDQVAHAAEVLGSPTAIDSANLNPAHTYGRGLAPLLLALALWGFGLTAYMLLKPVNSRALLGGVNPATLTFAAWLPGAVLGVLGGLILFGVLTLAPGLAPEHPAGAIGVLCLGAVSFVTIGHFLRTLLGGFGTMLSLVLLVLQLSACGGLYPMETTPALFQAIHPVLPMSYLVDGLRVTISGGLPERLGLDCAVLGGFLVAFLALTALALWRQRTPRMRRPHDDSR